jgi:hypothetical protein
MKRMGKEQNRRERITFFIGPPLKPDGCLIIGNAIYGPFNSFLE